MLSTVTLPIAIALWASTVLAAPPTTASGADGALCNKSVASNAVYPNSKANIDDRVSDLLNHMCWAEKVAQMGGVGGLLGDNSTYDYASYAEIAQLHNGTISPGSYLNYAEQAVPALKQIIATASQESRLHIPYINIGDGVNGPTLRGTTLFPPTFSMSQSWNRDLYTSVITSMREEFYACGINWVLSPELDVASDARYGRIGELYGEDPYLNGEFGLIFVNTMQTLNSKGYMKVAATLKHYVYGSELGGVNEASMLGGPNHIFNYLAAPFIKIFKNASPASIMPSYASIDGVPATMNTYLLQDVLRNTFGFTGIVVSDADAITGLHNAHNTASSIPDSGVQAVLAGMDLELAINFPSGFQYLVGNSSIPAIVSQVNTAVSRLLRLKFQMGLFDPEYSSDVELNTTLRAPSHLQANTNISRESIVLLQNDGILPIKKTGTTWPKVAVLGPFAQIIDTGTYAAWTNAENGNYTFLDALNAEFGVDNVNYVQGVDVLGTSNANISTAAAAASQAGLAIVTLGSVSVGYQDSLFSERTDGEGNTHASLAFPGLQQELLNAVIATGVPTILVMSGGQAFELTNGALNSSAIVHGFLGGEASGQAMVDILTGRVNPSGRLTLSYPLYSEVTPDYYNRLPSDYSAGAIQFPSIQENYLYPFGYGLSYTTFNLSGAALDKSSYTQDASIVVSTTLTNTGSIDGQEVVQVYFRQVSSSVIELPIKRLTGFDKVSTPAGESINVSITVPVQELGYYVNGKYRVDTGNYAMYVGMSSGDSDLQPALNFTIV